MPNDFARYTGYLALDRTNWKLGSRDINILMLAIVTRRFRVPLLFTLLPHQGSSDTGQYIAPMRRYLTLFGAASSPALSSSAWNGRLSLTKTISSSPSA